MTVLRDISLTWSLFHVLVLFIFLYESRYSLRKTIALTGIFMIPLLIINVFLFVYLGPARFGHIILLVCALPSLLFFFIISKNRDGRFLFTFCLTDTVSAEILVITNLLDYFLPGENYVVLFVTRLIAFPLAEFLTLKYFRTPYLKLQNYITHGWISFSGVSALFYVSLICESTLPVMIGERIEYLPHLVIILLLMPFMYANIFNVLYQQYKRYEAEEISSVLLAQTNLMEHRVLDVERTEETLRIQRHDMRHKLNTITTMIKNQNYDEVLEFIDASRDMLANTAPDFYCKNPVLNAVFSYYFQRAKTSDIRISQSISLPNELSVNVTELSIVFANALENAIEACMALPAEMRYIKCKCIYYPNLMFFISNPYSGTINIGSDGFPFSKEPNHGIGTRSIKAFCSKYKAVCEYKITDQDVTMRISLEIS